MPATPFRSECVLLSLGVQGVLLETARVLQGSSFAFGSASEERLEWSAHPASLHLVNPFLVSLLPEAVEVHDLVSLQGLQRVQISSPSPHLLSICSCHVESVPTPFSNAAIPSGNSSSSGAGPSTTQCVFLCNGEQLSVLKMIPISSQVAAQLLRMRRTLTN